MSDFLSGFRSMFSEEERKSELFRILATIGVNTEKVILEELNAEIRRSTEISVFPENKLRSWLAFFSSPVRNVISASGFGRVVVDSIEGGNSNSVSVKAGKIVRGSNGKEYQIPHDLTLFLGCSTPFSFVQGIEAVHTSKYSEFIAIPIESGKIDLSYVKVLIHLGEDVLDVLDVPVVSAFPAFPGDLSSIFPDLGTSVLDSSGNFKSDVTLWNPLLKNMESLWNAVEGVSIRPTSGFFPFLFNNTLFIKIYPGGVQGDSNYVPVPSHQTVTVKYRISDGAFGNLKQNQLDSFAEALVTEDGGTVKVTLYNDEAINGVNAPSRAELINLFRKRFFASSHVSSVPEYTAWFLAQPSVGDCLVVSDFERWRLSGSTSVSGFNITGAVSVYLVDSFGNPVHPTEPDSREYTPFIKKLDTDLEGVRDVAFLKYEEASVYWHFFTVTFRSVYSEADFTDSAISSIASLYSLSWVRSNGLSLFRNLDTDVVSAAVRGDSDVSGLRITPYHYCEHRHKVFSAVSSSITISFYQGEKPGGWYEYWEMNPDGKLGYYKRDSNNALSFDDGGVITNPFVEGVPCSVYREFIEISGSCSIYQYGKKLRYDASGQYSGWAWSGLLSDHVTSHVGDRLGSSIRFDLKGLAPGVLRCFWSIANEGLIPVGSDINSGFGIRKLPSEHSLLAGETYFGEALRFEKSI